MMQPIERDWQRFRYFSPEGRPIMPSRLRVIAKRAALIAAALYLAIGTAIGALWLFATNVSLWFCALMVVGWAPWLLFPMVMGRAFIWMGLGSVFFFTR